MLVEFKDVFFSYKKNKNRKDQEDIGTLDNISFALEQGRILSIVGPSGSGKTTIIKLINRLLDGYEGSIKYQGVEVRDTPKSTLRKSMGYSIQSASLFPHMTVRDNLEFTLKLSKMDKHLRRNRVHELMDILELPRDFLNKYPHELSGGQKQRISFGRAISLNQELILMDEPFSALDDLTRSTMGSEIKKLQQKVGCSIILITHNIEEALILGDEVLVLYDGSVCEKSTPKDIFFSDNEFVKEFIDKKYIYSILQKEEIDKIYGFEKENYRNESKGN